MQPIDSSTDLTETRIDGETVFRGRLLHVKRDRVRLPNGAESTREYVDHPGAAAMVALFDDGRILMERQYRYAPGRDLYEIPAGKVDAGEDAMGAARRELLEETGYVAARWSLLTTIDPLCAYSNERIAIYLARGLEHRGREPDDGEFLEVFTLPVVTAIDWVRNGRITDAKTIIGIVWAEKILAGMWQPA